MMGGFLPLVAAESKVIVSRHAVGEPTVLERGPHHAEVEHITLDTAADGSTRQTTHRYVHLEVGMNRQLPDGTWQPVETGLALEPGRAVAQGTQHQVVFAANLRTPGSITLTLPDGRRMRSHPYGLAYTDAASGKSVLIAEVRDSVGVVDGDQVLYPDALDGLDADFRFTTTKSLFEQDVILREAPPSPKSYGLDPATTQLEVWTEFLEAPEPVREELRAGNAARLATKDESLDFGSMRMTSGRAFRLAEADETLSVVVKEWIVLADGRRFLVEAVPVSAMTGVMEALPPKAGGARLSAPKASRMQALLATPQRQYRPGGSPANLRRLDRSRDTAWVERWSRSGVVLDYQLLNGTLNNAVFASGQTYLVTGAVTCSGTTRFEANAVIKFAEGGTSSLSAGTSVVWQGEPYRPIHFTAKDDDSVGEVIAGSTGAPGTSPYAGTALGLTGPPAGALTVSHLRIAHAEVGLSAGNFNGSTLTVRHVQFVQCGAGLTLANGLPSTPTYKVQNALMTGVAVPFLNGNFAQVQVDNLTVNGATTFNQTPFTEHFSLILQNSLLVAVANIGAPYSGSGVHTVTSAAGVFATAGGGAHYLAPGSPYRNAAVAVVDSDLRTDLRAMTTVVPLPLTGSLTTPTALTRTVPRDQDIVDIGYHYPALDYWTAGLTVSAALTLSQGVALGWSGTQAVTLQAGGQLHSVGTPAAPNVFVRCAGVHERPGSGDPGHGSAFETISTLGAGAPEPVITARFTRWVADGGDYHLRIDRRTTASGKRPAASISLRDCMVRGGAFQVSAEDNPGPTLDLQNNLWFQTTHFSSGAVALSAFQQTWRRSGITWSGLASATVRNCIFDNTSLSVSGTVVNSHNGYAPAAAPKLPGSAGSDVPVASVTYATGAFGDAYLGGSSFLNVGNQTAAAAGLGQYTVQTAANTRDTSWVDLGYHSVGVSTITGPVLDTDGDGWADYLEDLNGNGVQDTGELLTLSANGLNAPGSLQLFTPTQP